MVRAPLPESMCRSTVKKARLKYSSSPAAPKFLIGHPRTYSRCVRVRQWGANRGLGVTVVVPWAVFFLHPTPTGEQAEWEMFPGGLNFPWVPGGFREAMSSVEF